MGEYVFEIVGQLITKLSSQFHFLLQEDIIYDGLYSAKGREKKKRERERER